MTAPVLHRADPGRVVLVTAGLSAAGAAFGGFAGAAAFNLVILHSGVRRHANPSD